MNKYKGILDLSLLTFSLCSELKDVWWLRPAFRIPWLDDDLILAVHDEVMEGEGESVVLLLLSEDDVCPVGFALKSQLWIVNVAWVISTYQGPSVEYPALFNAEQRVHHPLHHVLVLVHADHLAGDISRLWPARHLYCLLPHTKTVLSKAGVVTKIWRFNDWSLVF